MKLMARCMVEDEERMELLGRTLRTCGGGSGTQGGHGCYDGQPPMARLDQVCLATEELRLRAVGVSFVGPASTRIHILGNHDKFQYGRHASHLNDESNQEYCISLHLGLTDYRLFFVGGGALRFIIGGLVHDLQGLEEDRVPVVAWTGASPKRAEKGISLMEISLPVPMAI